MKMVYILSSVGWRQRLLKSWREKGEEESQQRNTNVLIFILFGLQVLSCCITVVLPSFHVRMMHFSTVKVYWSVANVCSNAALKLYSNQVAFRESGKYGKYCRIFFDCHSANLIHFDCIILWFSRYITDILCKRLDSYKMVSTECDTLFSHYTLSLSLSFLCHLPFLNRQLDTFFSFICYGLKINNK